MRSLPAVQWNSTGELASADPAQQPAERRAGALVGDEAAVDVEHRRVGGVGVRQLGADARRDAADGQVGPGGAGHLDVGVGVDLVLLAQVEHAGDAEPLERGRRRRR